MRRSGNQLLYEAGFCPHANRMKESHPRKSFNSRISKDELMSERTPLMIVSDAITSASGLGRIARELAVRIHEDLGDVFDVATCGHGGSYSRNFPFPQYPITRFDNWAIPDL